MIEYVNPQKLEDLTVIVDRGKFVDIFTSSPIGDDCQAVRLKCSSLQQVIDRILKLKRKDSVT
jgi:hypothetical protein